MKTLKTDRIMYLDILRVCATFMVIVLHVAAVNWDIVNTKSLTWQLFNFADGISRWAVPVFVMISGSVMLDRDISIGTLFRKNIKRIVLAFVCWSAVYSLVNYIEGYEIRDVLTGFIVGPPHLWFLYMIVGLYLITPFVRRIVESDILTKYFLGLSFVFTFVVPSIPSLANQFGQEFGGAVQAAIGSMKLNFAVGFVFYYVLGFFLNKNEISKISRCIIYVLGIAGFAFTVGATAYVSVKTNVATERFYGNMTLNVMLESLAVFVFFRYCIGRLKMSEKAAKTVLFLSEYSFGVYLVHLLVIRQLDYLFGINTLSSNPLLMIVFITLVSAALSYALAFAFSRVAAFCTKAKK